MKKASFLWAFAALLVVLTSCKDVIEKDISEDTPTFILPTAGDTVGVNPVHFKWDELEGAKKYRIEIVSPSFSAIESFVVDSVVTGTNFYYGLDSAEYQVRLTAINAGYESKTTDPLTFWVGTSSGASNASVLLNTPLQGAYVNESFDGKFSWLSLPGANTYTFELHETATFAGPLKDIVDQLGSISLYSFTGAQLQEGTYCWGVKAYMSNGSETIYTKRTFYVDTTDPGTATQTAPVNGATVSLSLSPSVNFTWTFPTDVGVMQSPLYAKLEIATTTNFATTVASLSYSSGQTSATQNLNTLGLTAGTYYWRIIVWDEAGNEGTIPGTYRTLNVTN